MKTNLILISLIILLASCVQGKIKSLHKQDEYTTSYYQVDHVYNEALRQEIFEKYNQSIKILKECKNEKIKNRIDKIDFKKVFVLQASKEIVETFPFAICAFVYTEYKNVIYLNLDNNGQTWDHIEDVRNEFDEACPNRADFDPLTGTLVHEIMHLIDFHHATKQEAEEFEEILEECVNG